MSLQICGQYPQLGSGLFPRPAYAGSGCLAYSSPGRPWSAFPWGHTGLGVMCSSTILGERKPEAQTFLENYLYPYIINH